MIILTLTFTVIFSFLSCNLTDKKEGRTMEKDKDEIQKRLYSDVEFLTSLSPARNYSNITSLDKAGNYIQASFDKLNCTTEVQSFAVGNKEYKNIIASFGPTEGARIIVGAHYDVAGEQPGADDNASAVAGLLEIARMLDTTKAKLNNRIDLVAYSLEEPPFFAGPQMGSAVHAKYINKNQIPVKAMICLEMIGYFSDKPESQNFPDERLSKIYPHTGNFIIVVGRTGQEVFTQEVKSLMQKHSTIDVQSINLPPSNELAGLSDHRNYWKFGYDAVMINNTSFLRNPHYHKKTDTIETLDFDKMAEVVKGVFGVITNL